MSGTYSPSSVSIETEPEQADLLQACLDLTERGETWVVRALIGDGVQSRVWRLGTGSSDAPSDVVVKRFRPSYRFTSAQAVADEYDSLVALAAALSRLPEGRVRLRCPIPLVRWDWGYAMSLAGGTSLEELIDDGLIAGGPGRGLADVLVSGLVAFHAERADIYGDFHARNVLLEQQDRVWLVDPAPANRDFFTWENDPPSLLAMDIGYWIFSTTTTAARASLHSPRAVIRRCSFSATLLAAAIALPSSGTLMTDVSVVLRDFRSRLAVRGLRERVTTILSRVFERRVLRAAAEPRHHAGTSRPTSL